MNDFEKYGLLRSQGTDAPGAYLIAKRDGLNHLECIKMLRSVYGVSLEEAGKISFEADMGERYQDQRDKLVDEFANVFDEEFGPKNNQ